MFDCLISFVIPAYNAGLTLERAVLSIVKQKDLHAEVLIINDGSTDNTKDIAEELADSWSCVRVINTVNGGVARARNIGIEAALGDWISFVDADDEIFDGAYQSLLEAVSFTEYDIVFGIKEYYSQCAHRGHIYHELSQNGDNLNNINIADVHMSLLTVNDDSLSGSCTRAIFRQAFIEEFDLRFPVGVTMAEDFCFLLSCLSRSPKVGSIGILLYRVNCSAESVTQNAIDNIDGSMEYVNECLDELVDAAPYCASLVDIQRANNAWLRLDSHAKCGFRETLRISNSIFSNSRDRNSITRSWGPNLANKFRQLVLKSGLLSPVLPSIILRFKRWLGGFR